MGYMIFRGIDSRQFGVVVERIPIRARPERHHSVIDIQNGNSIVYAGQGYKSYTQPVVLGLRDTTEENIENIHDWLNGKGQLIFSESLDRYVEAVCYSQIAAQRIAGGLGKMTVNFTCLPYSYAVDNPWETLDLENAGDDKQVWVYGDGNEESLPTIKLYGNGNLNLQVNSNWITVRNVSEYCIVDVPVRRVFDKDGNVINNETINDLTKLKLNKKNAGASYIKVSGNVTQVDIKKNTRWT